MSDMKIDDATPDSSVGGNEIIPISDGGFPKSVTAGAIKDFVLEKIAELPAAGGVDASSDSVYILRGGAMRRVSASVLASAIMDYAFGLAGISGISGNEVLAIGDSGVKKTVTVDALARWLEDNIEVTPDYALADMTAAGTLGDSDLVLVAQAAGPRKATLATLKDYAFGKLAAYVGSLTAAQSVGDSDTLLLVQGGTAKKVTVAQIVSAVGEGCVTGPSSTTADKVPQWDSTAKKLKDGLTVTNSISSDPSNLKLPTEAAVKAAIDESGDVKGPANTTADKVPQWDSTAKKLKDGKSVVTSVASTGSDGNIPTEKAVRDAINDSNGVGAPTLTTENNIPQWDSTQKKLKNGKGVSTSIPSAASASHDNIPTEKAVRDAVDGLITAPSSHTENAIPTWGATNELKPGKSVVTVLGSTGSDDNIPTEKAVRDAIQPATASKNGLMKAADKAKLDAMANTGAVAEIGAALSDGDTVVVKQADATFKKSLLSRFWTYIMGKLPTYKIDDLAVGDDNTDLNASASRHGLCPKLSGNTSQFLRGDGSFAAPTGSAPYIGTDGTDPGTQGLVPAPAVGDEVKFLCGNGAWTTPPSAAGVDIPGAAAIDALADGDSFYVFDASASGYRRVSAAAIRAMFGGTKRYDTIFIPAGAMTPSSDNGATPGAVKFSDTTHDTLAFPSTGNASAEFSVAFPDGWDAGAVKFKTLWTFYDSTAGQSGQAVRFVIGGVSCADGEDISDAPTTTVNIDDLTQSANELCKSVASDALTLDGTNAAGNLVHFRITRDTLNLPAGATTLPTEAMLLGIIVQFGRTDSYEVW